MLVLSNVPQLIKSQICLGYTHMTHTNSHSSLFSEIKWSTGEGNG